MHVNVPNWCILLYIRTICNKPPSTNSPTLTQNLRRESKINLLHVQKKRGKNQIWIPCKHFSAQFSPNFRPIKLHYRKNMGDEFSDPYYRQQRGGNLSNELFLFHNSEPSAFVWTYHYLNNFSIYPYVIEYIGEEMKKHLYFEGCGSFSTMPTLVLKNVQVTIFSNDLQRSHYCNKNYPRYLYVD